MTRKPSRGRQEALVDTSQEVEPRAEVPLRPEFLRRIAHELRSPISLVAHVL